uniref:Uncharacterized protein n=1 Tax=uncultured prokaryote TaxID=198431 RepID=A0A0H5QP33_9ZZZZ|nr:hypothetical protein [uncultured prokaryote]
MSHYFCDTLLLIRKLFTKSFPYRENRENYSLNTALSFKIAGGNSKMLLFLAGLLVFLLSYFIILLL